MYVCICNAVTEKEIREAVKSGCVTIDDIIDRTDAGTHCGCCQEYIEEIIENEGRK
jgi:bacterioferritin-associated ferredoxin